jgi:hypothetical protein
MRHMMNEMVTHEPTGTSRVPLVLTTSPVLGLFINDETTITAAQY